MENKIRTEEEILKDFEKLEYQVIKNKTEYDYYIYLKQHLNYIGGIEESKCISIDLIKKQYNCFNDFYKFEENITMQEHKLLNDLFVYWRWL